MKQLQLISWVGAGACKSLLVTFTFYASQIIVLLFRCPQKTVDGYEAAFWIFKADFVLNGHRHYVFCKRKIESHFAESPAWVFPSLSINIFHEANENVVWKK